MLICLWENKYADKTVDCLGFLAWLSAFNEFALFCLRKTSATLCRQSAPRSQSFAFMPFGIVSSICSLSGRCSTEIRFATCVDKTGKRYNIELLWNFADWRQRAKASACPFYAAKQENHFGISN